MIRLIPAATAWVDGPRISQRPEQAERAEPASESSLSYHTLRDARLLPMKSMMTLRAWRCDFSSANCPTHHKTFNLTSSLFRSKSSSFASESEPRSSTGSCASEPLWKALPGSELKILSAASCLRCGRNWTSGARVSNGEILIRVRPPPVADGAVEAPEAPEAAP
jgi:hypothetical protein